MTLDQLLLQLGLNITSSFIYDRIKKYEETTSTPNITGLKQFITKGLLIDGAYIKADQIVNFLAKNGDIKISHSNIFSNSGIHYAAISNSIHIGSNTSSITPGTSITLGEGCHIHMGPGTSITQGGGGTSFIS